MLIDKWRFSANFSIQGVFVLDVHRTLHLLNELFCN